MRKKQILISILIFFMVLYLHNSNFSEGISIPFPLFSHSESEIQEDLKLTVTINSRILKWDSILALKLSIMNISTNQTIPNTNVDLKVYAHRIIYLKTNITLKYYLIYENMKLKNGTKEIIKYIPHIPTLLPYLIEVRYFEPKTETELSVSFPFLVLSDRKPMIPFLSFEMFIILYFIALILLPIILLINKRFKPNLKSKIEVKN